MISRHDTKFILNSNVKSPQKTRKLKRIMTLIKDRP